LPLVLEDPECHDIGIRHLSLFVFVDQTPEALNYLTRLF
jgi:hypothetical protein